MKATSDLKVIIIGGGLGGLCLAQALYKENIAVEVYERDPSALILNQGYRINLNPDGLKALQSCLPAPLYSAMMNTAGKQGSFAEVFDNQLNIIYRQDLARSGANTRIAVNRQTLREILLHGIGDFVHFNKTFCRLEQSDNEATVFFTDGTSSKADLVVGADGANSALRKQLLPAAEPKNTGYYCIYGKAPFNKKTIDCIPGIENNVFTGVITPGDKTLIIGSYIKTPEFNTVNAYLPDLKLSRPADYLMCALLSPFTNLGLTARSFKSLSAQQLMATIKNSAANWHPALQLLLNSIDESSIFPVIIRYSPQINGWENDRVTFIGDAVHTMLPAGGAGANTAFKDTALLCGKLCELKQDAAGLSQAINEYNTEMLRYGFEAVKRSLTNATQFYRMPAVTL